jgi:ornithine cyclodeaminase
VSGPRILDAEAVWAVPPGAVADALDEAFRAGLAPAPLRSSAPIDGGSMLLMPAADGDGSGLKALTLVAANPARGLPAIQGSYLLFDARGSVRAVIDAAALTAVRTAAVSAVAARHLAPPEPEDVLVVGGGVQARSHLRAMAAELAPRRLLVWTRRPAAAAEVLAWAGERGIAAEEAGPAAVSAAGVICTCTSAEAPLFDGRTLRAGALVIAVGAYRPDTRELDGAAVGRSAIVVEDEAAARAEAGDLLMALAEGALPAERPWLSLSQAVRGTPVRREPGETVVFKSVGVAGEDLAAARALLRNS